LWGDKPWTTSKLAESYQGVCPFGKVDEILSKTKISINLHYAKKSNGANLRVFESARAGACLLTDWKSDMANLYVPGEEIMIYNNSDDFKHKIRDLLGNPGLTQKLGMRSFQKTKREHTYVHRIKAILDTIR
jgi:spore maturation protein CgeB